MYILETNAKAQFDDIEEKRDEEEGYRAD